MELTVPPAEGTGSFGSPTDAFAHLLTAMTAADVQYAYKKLLELLGLKNPASISKLSDALAEQLPHRSKQLLATLTERARSVAAAAQQPKRRSAVAVAIVGAGPVGLRTAIELAMLGMRVEVLEGRAGFTRLQVLHLWEWVEADLIGLGIKSIDAAIFATVDVRRCTTMQLQLALLKVCCLLGVRVRFSCSVADGTSIAIACSLTRIDVLVDASGARCPLLDALGFRQDVALRSARALCIVLSLINDKTAEELQLREVTQPEHSRMHGPRRAVPPIQAATRACTSTCPPMR